MCVSATKNSNKIEWKWIAISLIFTAVCSIGISLGLSLVLVSIHEMIFKCFLQTRVFLKKLNWNKHLANVFITIPYAIKIFLAVLLALGQL